MSPNCIGKVSQHYRDLDAMSIFYEGADLDLTSIRKTKSSRVKRMCISFGDEEPSSECDSDEF